MIHIKRVYERPRKQDGFRVLVDRVWPRGVSKQAARIDVWLKDVAPSTGLRKWFGHDPAKWDEFRKRYWKELQEQEEAVAFLRDKSAGALVTLVFGAKDAAHSNAAALKEYLDGSDH